jgi:hypothetical protein
MKKLTRAQLFVQAKEGRAARAKTGLSAQSWFVTAARDRAVETAQQHVVPSMKRPPTVLQIRRLAERLSARS